MSAGQLSGLRPLDRLLVRVPQRTRATTPHRARATSRTTSRVPAIDAGRFLAAVGVVYLHAVQSDASAPFMVIGQLGVPFYLFIALLLQARSFRADPTMSPLRYTAGRVARLFPPFLFWCAIYFVARGAKNIVIDGIAPVAPSWGTLLSGTQYHLWFVPFLLILSALAAGVHARLARANHDPRRARIAAIACAVIGVAFCATNVPPNWAADFRDPNYALFQMWRSMPAACFAMSFAILFTAGTTPARRSQPLLFPAWFALAAGASLVCLLVAQTGQHQHSAALRGLSGLLCAVIALTTWRGRIVESIAHLGRFSFGIYLSHVLIVEVLHAVLHVLKVRATLTTDLVTFAISLGAATMIAIVLSRHRKLAWTVGL